MGAVCGACCCCIGKPVDMLIRPPKFQYNLQDLDGPQFMCGGKPCTRTDVTLTNRRGYKIVCSFFEPQMRPAVLPCVIFLHGKGGSRMTAKPAIQQLLPMDICVFCFDFSGCAKSEGPYVSMGFFEREDVDAAVRYLQSTKRVSQIALWGRSMGAATTLLYCGDFQQNIACLVVDSPFHSLRILILEWLRERKNVPGFLARILFWFVRNRVQFLTDGANIYKCKPMMAAPKIKIPGLFGVASGDSFTKPSYVRYLHQIYKGPKEYVEIAGDHDTERPPDYYFRIANFIRSNIYQGTPITQIDLDSQPMVEWDDDARPIPRPRRKVEDGKEQSKATQQNTHIPNSPSQKSPLPASPQPGPGHGAQPLPNSPAQAPGKEAIFSNDPRAMTKPALPPGPGGPHPTYQGAPQGHAGPYPPPGGHQPQQYPTQPQPMYGYQQQPGQQPYGGGPYPPQNRH